MRQNGTVEPSGAFRFGSVLDWLWDLGLLPALFGPKVLSCKMTVLCFTQPHTPGQAGLVLHTLLESKWAVRERVEKN